MHAAWCMLRRIGTCQAHQSGFQLGANVGLSIGFSLPHLICLRSWGIVGLLLPVREGLAIRLMLHVFPLDLDRPRLLFFWDVYVCAIILSIKLSDTTATTRREHAQHVTFENNKAAAAARSKLMGAKQIWLV
jgi:hypothetical protein